MRVWFLARLDYTDGAAFCTDCGKQILPEAFLLIENRMISGGLPNVDEIHPEPTGNFMCLSCGQKKLI